MTLPARLAAIFCTVMLTACGGGTPTSPASQQQPLNLTGTWSGTLSMSNYPTLAVTVTMTQAGTTITGNWTTPSGAWKGQITSGRIDNETSFTGSFSMMAPSDQPDIACGGNAAVTGPVSRSNTLRWTSPQVAGNVCTNTPTELVWQLTKQ